MARKARRPSRDHHPKRPRAAAVEESPRHVRSATSVAAEALRTGIVPFASGGARHEIPREDETIRVGDPDDSTLSNEYVGEETPGGSATTPDQNMVDEIGRAYGLQEEDSGALQSGADVLARRDRHRGELQPPRRPQS